jgi:pyrroloquinoline quinone biosynthesis protein B
MKIRVLGSGAGGGFPQWNCNCDNCARWRSGELNGAARTQSSIAVSGDGDSWVLLNASPDIRAQIESFPALQPARKRRDTAIAAVLLVDAQVDHTTGLMTLRESDEPLSIYCTRLVHEDLTSGYPLLSVLEHFCGGGGGAGGPRPRVCVSISRCPRPALHRDPDRERSAALLAAPPRTGPGRQHRRSHPR